VATGTIVDATIINAPSSTKNADKARDPEMHQTRKGKQWYFGMKGHFGRQPGRAPFCAHRDVSGEHQGATPFLSHLMKQHGQGRIDHA